MFELNLTTFLFEKFTINVSKLELLTKIQIQVRSEMYKCKYFIKEHIAACKRDALSRWSLWFIELLKDDNLVLHNLHTRP